MRNGHESFAPSADLPPPTCKAPSFWIAPFPHPRGFSLLDTMQFGNTTRKTSQNFVCKSHGWAGLDQPLCPLYFSSCDATTGLRLDRDLTGSGTVTCAGADPGRPLDGPCQRSFLQPDNVLRSLQYLIFCCLDLAAKLPAKQPVKQQLVLTVSPCSCAHPLLTALMML